MNLHEAIKEPSGVCTDMRSLDWWFPNCVLWPSSRVLGKLSEAPPHFFKDNTTMLSCWALGKALVRGGSHIQHRDARRSCSDIAPLQNRVFGNCRDKKQALCKNRRGTENKGSDVQSDSNVCEAVQCPVGRYTSWVNNYGYSRVRLKSIIFLSIYVYYCFKGLSNCKRINTSAAWA